MLQNYILEMKFKMGQQEVVNGLMQTIDGLLKVVTDQQERIEHLEKAMLSTGDMIHSHDEGIQLIIDVLKSNGLV